MSITKGIEIRKKDPAKDRPPHERPCVSWKDRCLDYWIEDWLYAYESDEPGGYYKKLGEFEYECGMLKEDLLRLASDMENRRFELCPEGYRWFSGHAATEDLAALYGTMFRQLAERLQEDEMLVYYDCGC